MAIINSPNFSLNDVRVELGGVNPYSLSAAIAVAVDGSFDITYKGAKDRLSNFRNYGALDTTPPSNIEMNLSSVTDTLLSYSHTVATDNVAVAGHNLYDSVGTLLAQGNSISSFYQVTSLTPYTNYSYKIKARDTATPPNVSVNFSSTRTFKTLPARVTGVISAITATTATVTWSSSIGATSYDIKVWNSTTSTEHVLVNGVSSGYGLTSLTNGSTYLVFLRTNDSANALTTIGQWDIGVSFIAVSTADTTPPSTPVLDPPMQFVGEERVTLEWSTSTDNIGVTGYTLERKVGINGTYSILQTHHVTSFNDAGVTYGFTYYYRVKARDAAGNFSSYSNVEAITVSDFAA